MKRIGVISDTHGLLRPEVKEVLKTCQAILHGGDVDNRRILDELAAMGPLYTVRGNNDGHWAEMIGKTHRFQLFGLKFYMIHNKNRICEDVSDRDIIVYGHTHIYTEKMENGQLWLNPGACGLRRFTLPLTMAVIETEEDGSYQVQRIDVETIGSSEKPESLPVGREKEIIRAIARDMNKKKPVALIAAKHGVSEKLTEQICRLIVTHPGVDADGIYDRLQHRSDGRY